VLAAVLEKRAAPVADVAAVETAAAEAPAA
jgi:hypothetical protein